MAQPVEKQSMAVKATTELLVCTKQKPAKNFRFFFFSLPLSVSQVLFFKP